MKPDTKIALSISGLPRFTREVTTNQIWALGDENKNNGIQLDIFINTWEDEKWDKRNILSKMKEWVEMVDTGNSIIKLANINIETEKQPGSSGYFKDPSCRNSHSMLYAIMKGMMEVKRVEIKRRENYDLIIRSRPDIAFIEKVKIWELMEYSKRHIENIISPVIPIKIRKTWKMEPHEYVMDQFFCGQSHSMHKLSCAYMLAQTSRHHTEKAFNTENMLYLLCKELNIKVSRMKNVTALHRGN